MTVRWQPRLILALAVLAASPLACTFPGGVIGSTPTPQFSTATPGGSISVSLLTTTPTAIAAPGQITTPIAPVATATAFYLTAVAGTTTASAPTPTLPGIVGQPARCPLAGNPALPVQSPLFSRYAEIVDQFLSAGGAPTVLEATLRNWGAITGKGGLVRADRDFTGDGVPEVFVAALDPAYASRDLQPGDLFIFGCQDGAYRLLYDAGYSPDRGAPIIQSADDITGDLINDMIYTVTTCGLKGCQAEVNVISWSPTLDTFSSLTAEKIVVYQPTVVVSDLYNDGKKEISVTNGLNPDPAAGPQRQITTIYSWDGTQFTVSAVQKSPLQYRIHAIYDGDDALLAGDAKDAITAYQTAIINQQLQSWGGADEAATLIAFARFRLMLAYILGGNVSRAQSTYNDLSQLYAQPTPEIGPDGQPLPTPVLGPRPGEDFARMADLFWQNYSMNRDAKRACELVTNYALVGPIGMQTLNSFGYANRQYQPQDLCPLK